MAGLCGTPRTGAFASTSSFPSSTDPSASTLDPFSTIRPRISASQARTNAQLVELGEGWVIKYRVWKGPALFVEGEGPKEGRMDYDPLRPPLGTVSPFPMASLSSSSSGKRAAKGKEADASGPPAPKKAKRRSSAATIATKGGNAFDDLIAEDLGTLTSSSIPSPSLSASAPFLGATMPSLPAPPVQLSTSSSGMTHRVPVALKKARAAAAAAAAAASTPSPASDAPAVDNLASPPPEPTTSSSSSVQTLRDRLATLSPDFLANDPILRAERDLRQREKVRADEGKDRMGLIWITERKAVQLGRADKAEDPGKGKEKEAEDVKGKRKEQQKEDLVAAAEGEGRLLWAFCIVRGPDAVGFDDGKEAVAEFDGLSFEGLEAFTSGELTHTSLFPDLYSSTSGSATPTFTRPLSLPARSYPSALALSAQIYTVPSAATPLPSFIAMQAAYAAFRSTVSSLLLDELVQHGAPEALPLRLADSVVYLPRLPSAASKESPLSLVRPPAIRVSIPPPSLNQSTIFVLSSISELSYGAPTPVLLPDTPLLLAPVDFPATLVRTLIQLPPDHLARLSSDWRDELNRACIPDEERDDYLLCALDLPDWSRSQDRIEVVWPRALVIVDESRKSSSHDERVASQAGPAASLEAHGGEASRADGKSNETRLAKEKENRPVRASPQQVRRADSLLNRRSFAERAVGARSATASSRRSGTTEGEQAVARLGTGDGPNVLRRRTDSVWSWMGDEGTRREEEREEERKRKEREEQERVERLRQEKGAEQEKGKGDASTVAPAGAAAPINMRTPMSLGTSSTEAPSPAELYQPLSGSAGPSDAATRASTAAAQAGSAPHAMESDFGGADVYPSPAEPGSSASALAQTASSAPMSALDAAFSEFDWGDGTFGTSGMGRAARDEGHDRGFDDGGLLGLTDDDFSFFDAPTPAPGSSALATSIGLSMTAPTSSVVGDQSFSALPDVAGIDSGFDFFSTAPPHFTATASTSLPFTSDGVFGSASTPHFLQQSPTTTFPFGALDPLTPNALGLAAPSPHAPTPSAGIFGSVAHLSPKAHNVSVTTPTSTISPAAISYSPLLAQGEASPVPTQQALGSLGPLDGFHPLAFASPQSNSDAKYDPRKGKFGLPSPDSDNEGRAARVVDDEEGHLRRWYQAVCDPRYLVAQRLRRPKATVASSDSTSRSWTRRLPVNPFVPIVVDGATPVSLMFEPADAEFLVAESDSEDAMDVDASETDSRGLGVGVEDDDSPSVRKLLASSCHAALLAEPRAVRHRHLKRVKAQATRAAPPVTLDSARELTYALIAEQIVINSEFREPVKLADAKDAGLVCIDSIVTIARFLGTICSNLGPSPLFSDQADLPALVEAPSVAFQLRIQRCIASATWTAVDFWRPMGFEPLTGAKDVTAFVILEDRGAEVRACVKEWAKLMSAAYQGLRLGEHALGAKATEQTMPGGFLALPPGALSTTHTREELEVLYSALLETAKTSNNTVVYLVMPSSESPLASKSPLAGILHQIGKSRSTAVNMVACPVPLSSIMRATSPAPEEPSRLLRLALNVYDQLQVPIERLRLPAPETFPSARPPPIAPLGPAIRLFQAPAFSIAPPKPRKVGFVLSWPPPSLEVAQRHRILHIAYASTPTGMVEGEWLVITIIDERGEIWRVSPRVLKLPNGAVADVHRARVVWTLLKGMIDCADVEWRIVVCKVGVPSPVEAKAWDSILREVSTASRRQMHVSFVCVELDPSLALDLSTRAPSRPATSSTVISEDGEVTFIGERSDAPDKSPIFDHSSSTLTFTPPEPVSLSDGILIAPASTYIFTVPRFSTGDHTSSPDPSGPPIPAVSAYALHFLLSHRTRNSAYTATLKELLADVTRSFVELAALGQARFGTSGRMSWHLEAARQALAIIE
ncbi:proteophosphoglycan ppg4 [Rhodotorula toruloides]|uniref:Mediator of RNA polymerase II transcription subunit 13 n=1 Tax=Rhodotorula toruloides TaxID=5286 RepID=A0A511KE01_RHOTO|nr:proteophosphoglycan ppg4 [Rhodotorula toruloides]